MAAGNRRRASRKAGTHRGGSSRPDDLHRLEALAHGGARPETRRGIEWLVRDVSAARALKAYRCPGCEIEVPAGQAHVVAWRSDHVLGEDAGLRERRHWHSHCWRLG